MRGAIVGDVVGSRFEFDPCEEDHFAWVDPHACEFTDDTVLTCAVAEALTTSSDMTEALHSWARRYPNMSWGARFVGWMQSDDPQPYQSLGNGSAMRVSPCGWLAASEEQALQLAMQSALPTHDHPEGIKGAQAVALAIFLARKSCSSDEIRQRVMAFSGYQLDISYEEMQPRVRYDETCPVSVPEAIVAALDATSFEDAVRKAIHLKADADTQAAIAGSIAEARFGGVPEELWQPVEALLLEDVRTVIKSFDAHVKPLG